jgi:hypothetical protein
VCRHCHPVECSYPWFIPDGRTQGFVRVGMCAIQSAFRGLAVCLTFNLGSFSNLLAVVQLAFAGAGPKWAPSWGELGS